MLEFYNKVCLEVYRRLVFLSLSELVCIHVLMSRQTDVTRFTCICIWVFVFLSISHVLFLPHRQTLPGKFQLRARLLQTLKQFASSLALFFLWAPFISFKNVCASVYFVYFSTLSLSLFQLEIMQGQLDSLTWSVMLTVYVQPPQLQTHTHSLSLSKL